MSGGPIQLGEWPDVRAAAIWLFDQLPDGAMIPMPDGMDPIEAIVSRLETLDAVWQALQRSQHSDMAKVKRAKAYLEVHWWERQ